MLNIGRCLAAAAVVVAGTCTALMNWRFSYQLGSDTWDSYTWATFSVALDVTKWMMLPCAALAWSHHKLRALAAVAIWIVATTYSFTAALGFAASNRDHTLAKREDQLQLLQAIEVMKASPRWQSSAACADATTAASKEFCATYRAAVEKQTSSLQSADPQSSLIAKLTGHDIGNVRIALQVFLALACEVVPALGLIAIFPPSEGRVPQTPRTPWKPPAWPLASERGPARRVATSRDKDRQSI